MIALQLYFDVVNYICIRTNIFRGKSSSVGAMTVLFDMHMQTLSSRREYLDDWCPERCIGFYCEGRDTIHRYFLESLGY